MEPRNRFQGTNSASLCSLAGRHDNPIPSRFLAPIDCLKIPAQSTFTFCLLPSKRHLDAFRFSLFRTCVQDRVRMEPNICVIRISKRHWQWSRINIWCWYVYRVSNYVCTHTVSVFVSLISDLSSVISHLSFFPSVCILFWPLSFDLVFVYRKYHDLHGHV